MIRAAVLLVAAALAACGGDGEREVPADAVAVVGQETVTKAELDAVMDGVKRSYEAEERPFPEAGSPEYNTLKNQAVQFLVQRAQFEQKADDLGVAVTDAQVERRLDQIVEQYFGGDEAKYRAQIEQQRLTDTQVRRDIRAQLLQEGILKKVTEGVKVTDREVEAHYEKNKAQYGTPESRDIRHILVSSKKQADALHAQLEGGADFAALAKKHSTDTASKATGGKLTITRGQTVAAFDKKAFELGKDEISAPVKTEFGFHLIQALSAVKPATTTPLKDVKEAIRGQLLQEKKNKAMTKWVDELKADYEDKVAYAVGYTPPATATGPTTSENE